MASKRPADSEKNSDWETGYKIEDFKALQKDGDFITLILSYYFIKISNFSIYQEREKLSKQEYEAMKQVNNIKNVSF